MRERIEKLIREYPEKKMELECLEKQLRHFRGVSETDMIETMVFSQPQGERVSSSGTADKTAKVALSYRDRMESINGEWYRHLEEEYLKLNEEVRFFEGALWSLRGKSGQIIRDIVLDGQTWEMAADNNGISRRTVGYHRKQAIDDLVSLYEKREKTELAYILS